MLAARGCQLRLYSAEEFGLDGLVVYTNEEEVRDGRKRKRMQVWCITTSESGRRHTLNKDSLADSISNSSAWGTENGFRSSRSKVLDGY
jgi:hypothetical protein